MELLTRDFGELEIDDNEIIDFKQGIPGFTKYKKYVLLTLSDDSPFLILQSIKEQNLAFITVNPWDIISDYEFIIKESIEKQLKIESEADLLILVIGTVHDSLENMTVNLAAPIVINFNQKLGKQVILEETDYSLRYHAFPGKNKQVAK